MISNQEIADKSKTLLRSRNTEDSIKKNLDTATVVDRDMEIYRNRDGNGRRRQQAVTYHEHKEFESIVLGPAGKKTQDNHTELPNDSKKNYRDADDFRQEIMSHQFNPQARTYIPSPTNIPKTAVVVQEQNDEEGEIAQFLIAAASIVSLFVLLFLVVRWMTCRHRNNKQKKALEVYDYLLTFDIEDVVVGKAATGGWHGVYKNQLAEGIVDSKKNDSDNSTIRTARTIELMVDDEDCQHLTVDTFIYDETDIYLTANDDVFSPI